MATLASREKLKAQIAAIHRELNFAEKHHELMEPSKEKEVMSHFGVTLTMLTLVLEGIVDVLPKEF